MLVNYIKELLYKHDCVVIPGFGGLIARYEGATIHPSRKSIIPPTKSVAFNESLQVSDGLLESTICRMEDCSMEEAVIKLKMFVAAIEDEIEEIGHYKLAGIGKFFYNEEISLQFEADEKENFLEDSYALPELYFKPIEREDTDMAKVPPRPRPVVRRPAPPRPATPGAKQNVQEKAKPVAKQRPPKPPKPPKEKKNREPNKKPIYLILPILLLIGGAIGAIFLSGPQEIAAADISGGHDEVVAESNEVEEEATSSEEENFDSEDAVIAEDGEDSEESEDVEETVIEEDVVEEEPVSEPEPEVVEEPTITPTSGRYHVIIASYPNRNGAERRVAKMGRGEVVEASGRYRVSVQSFSTRADADAEISDLRATYGADSWIYKN